jgi:hypothetical protein
MSMVLTISLIGPELCEGDGEVRAGCEEFSATNIVDTRQARGNNQY